MGEAKRRAHVAATVDAVTRHLVDEGKLIEAGWLALKITSIPKDASLAQLTDMRTAFFAGAQHLFASLMTLLEPGEQPTEKDLKRLDLIEGELRGFIARWAAAHVPTEGSA